MTTTGAEQTALSVLAFLAESSVRALACAVAAGLALALFRPRRTSVALCLWTVVLYGALAMPVLERMVPGIGIPVPAIATPSQDSPTAAVAPVTTHSGVAPFGSVAGEATSSILTTPVDHASRTPVDPATTALAIYLIGVAILLLRGGVGWVVTRRLERTTRPIVDADLLARLARQSAAAGVRAAPLLTESPSLVVPVTTSVLRPMIILPSSWHDWNPAKLDAVLVHELAHIARRDTLTQRFSLIYRAIFWPNPFSWWLHHRLAVLAEQASDEAALNAGADRTTYAETLVGFFAAQTRGAGRRAVWHVAMARGGSAGAERRVHRVLSWERGRSTGFTKAMMLGVVLASAPVMVLAAAVRPEAGNPGSARAIGLLTVAPHVGSSTATAGAPAEERGAPTSSPTLMQSQSSLPSSTEKIVDAPKRPLTANQVAGRRVWILLFDQGSMLAADMQKALDGAIRWADEKMGDTDLVALASIGTGLQIIQDFTNDRGKIRSALQKLGTSTAPAAPIVTPVSQAELDTFGADMRLRAIKTICDSVASIQQHKAILYFSTGITRGTDNAVEARAVENACSRANTSFDPVDSRGLQVVVAGGSSEPVGQSMTSPKTGVGLSLAVNQKDCPVTLVSTTSNVTDGAYVTVVARNDSAKVVRSVTVAAVVQGGHDYYFRAEPLRFFTSPALGTWIPPGETRTLESHVIDMKTLDALAAGSEATLGVVSVDFADGSTWTYDLKTKGTFERAQVPSGNGMVIYQPGNGLKNPVPIRSFDPQYTDEARRAKLQGDVELDAVILADGSVGNVRVTKSLDTQFGLDAQAIAAARQWLFKPAMKDGSPVNMIVGLSMEFKLHDPPPAKPAAPVVKPGMYDGHGKPFYFFNDLTNAQGIVPPKTIKQVNPKYTSDALRAKIQGDVEVDVVVLTDGTVGDVRVTKSLDAGLDEQAIAAARQWRFQPATKDGQPVEYTATLSLEFRVHDGPPAPAAVEPYAPDTPGLIAPKVIKWGTPKYTSDAMRAKIFGTVELDVVVQADGTIGEIRITKSLDTKFGLDQEAIAAAKGYTFTAATLNGAPVAAIVKLMIEFRLH